MPFRGFHRYSLRMALVAFVVGPVVVALLAVGLITSQVIARWAERRMQEEVELVASTIRLPLGRALADGRAREIERSLRAAVRADPIFAVFVYDARGVPVAAVGEPVLPVTVDIVSRVVVDNEKVGGYTRLGERRVYAFAVPLRDSRGQPVGILQVVRRRSDFDQALAGLRRQVLGVLLLSCFGVSGLVLWGHDRAVGRALGQLVDDIERIDAGHVEHRADGQGPREVAEVASALNAMLDGRDRDEAEIAVRREREDELEEQLAHAEKLAAIGRLASGVAHELGTPLSVIDGHAQRLLRRDDMKEPPRRAVEKVRHEVGRMSTIVRQLLDFGRRRNPRRRSVDVARSLGAATASVADDLAQGAVALEVKGPDEPVVAFADPGGLERIVINLIHNALDASPGGSIEVSYGRQGDEVWLSVEDDGEGIPPELRARIFEPFFTTKAVGEGTGLGLAVVHGLVDEQGGRIEVDDGARGGARFRIYLPDGQGRSDPGEASA